MLDLKYRPNKFEDFLGNISTVQSLNSFIHKKSWKALLFYGQKGTGKTTLARIIGKTLDFEITELDIGLSGGVDEARQIAKIINIRSKNPRLFILDEAHKATNAFESAMLKTLEEPPPNNYFILCTTEVDKILTTILGRCLQYNLTVPPPKELLTFLIKVVNNEGNSIIDKKILTKIIEKTEGNPRESVLLLEQVIYLEDLANIDEIIQNHVSTDCNLKTNKLCQALLKFEPWDTVKSILNDMDTKNPDQIRIGIRHYMLAILKKEVKQRAYEIATIFSQSSYRYDGVPSLYFDCYSLCSE